VCVCTVTDFSSEDKAIAASNFARRFIGVLDRESPILGNFAPTEAENRTNRRAAVDVRSACVDNRQSPSLAVLVFIICISTCSLASLCFYCLTT